MERTTVDGELNQAAGGGRGAGVTFAVASHADEAGLRALLRATPTPGAVSLRFEREPDYFAGEGVSGARDITIVARRDGRVVSMGRCSRRELYVGGRRRAVGYLGELRLVPGTPRGVELLREGYAFLGRQEATCPEGPADFYFTSVAASNTRARAVLESGRLGLPVYSPLAALATVAWPVGRHEDKGAAEKPEEAALSKFLDAEARRHALAMPWAATTWEGLRPHGLDAGDFCVVRRDGRIVAAGGVWDQSRWRQTVVAGYAGALRWGRGVVNAGARLAGRPGLPAAGARLRQACIHPLAVAAEATAAEIRGFLDRLGRRARRRGVEWLVASVAAEDGLRAALLSRPGAREYATRLYTVRLPGLAGEEPERGQSVRPEAGLL